MLNKTKLNILLLKKIDTEKFVFDLQDHVGNCFMF